ncbi:MAG TPA: 50S ribosomal protein L13 [Planctomycetes bacterium]|nr:50S ribosomal protein L13 [Planctomycetota bacterium]
MKSFLAKPAEVERAWHLVDASQVSLGRMASRIALILQGKHKPSYTPGVDTGDFVVVTNAAKLVVTGRKAQQKVYRYHTGWVGGLKEVPFERMLERHPERIIQLAVRRMLPKTVLGKQMLSKLKVYAGAEHPHQAQDPKALSL